MGLELSRRAFVAGVGAMLAMPKSVAFAQGEIADAPIADTAFGPVRGFVRNGTNVYLGIPYGAPTSGEARFLPPAPPTAWTEVREAIRFGQRSPQAGAPLYTDPVIGQYMTGGRAGEAIAMDEPMGEDCLVLNVLTPGADDKKRPVMFYMHGGGFNAGSGAPMSLSDRMVTENDIVLVTVNHRLGALGFLYLGEEDERFGQANVSILDLVAALEWVRDNIGNFGGDPGNVTIYGESGGGAKVAMLSRHPAASGLFQRLIFQSGLLPEPLDRSEAAENTRTFFEAAGIEPGDVSALQQLDLDQIIAAQGRARVDAPVDDEAFLAGVGWDEALAPVADKPMILGYCAHEASLFAGGSNPALFDLTWETLPAEMAVYLEFDVEQVNPIIDAYRAAAPQDEAPGIFFRILGDAFFGQSFARLRELKAAQGAPVYSYFMAYDTRLGDGILAFHTAELPLTGRLVLQPESEALSKVLATAWTSFARDGDPNGEGVPDWPTWDASDDRIMVFDVQSAAQQDPQTEARGLLFELIGGRPYGFARPTSPADAE